MLLVVMSIILYQRKKRQNTISKRLNVRETNDTEFHTSNKLDVLNTNTRFDHTTVFTQTPTNFGITFKNSVFSDLY